MRYWLHMYTMTTGKDISDVYLEGSICVMMKISTY